MYKEMVVDEGVCGLLLACMGGQLYQGTRPRHVPKFSHLGVASEASARWFRTSLRSCRRYTTVIDALISLHIANNHTLHSGASNTLEVTEQLILI